MRIREGTALVAGAALVAALLSLALVQAWVRPAVTPPPKRVRVVAPAVSPSPSPSPAASPSPSPSPSARGAESPSPSPRPSPSPSSRPPRTVLTPTPEAAPPVEVPVAPDDDFVEVPLGSPSPLPSPGLEESPAAGPLAVDARLDRWPADGPDPAVRVRLTVANPGTAPAAVEHAEVVYLNQTGELGRDRQDLGTVDAGDSKEAWFYYGNAARFWDVGAQLRLVYRVGGETFVVEREVK